MSITNDEQILNLLTLNCWGIPLVSKNRLYRMEAIAEKCVTDDYDVVCLQEIWSVSDFKMMRAKVCEKLPYSHYFYSGVVGSGICMFSRFPIQDVMFHKWPLNGYVHKIHHGDWFGGKGVGLCKIKLKNFIINVYVAHLHAEYNRDNDEYKAHRVLQAFDTAQFIRMTMEGSDAVVLGGDLNTEPKDIAYRIIRGVAGLEDACSISNSKLGTNECANNSYTPKKLAKKEPDGKRIDHILYLGSKNSKIEVANYKHPFPKRVPNKDFSYSDHEAIMASFKLRKGEFDKIVGPDVKESLKEALAICQLALKSIKRERIWYLIASCILVVPLIWSMGLEYKTPYIGISIGINVGRLFLTAVLCYVIFMSTLWNSVEKNALKAGYRAMELHLNQLNNQLSST
ncbi:putative neutral sphingomyelinase [Neodiprion pinetum]|uniref:sphingomyelin phosphodiesterase n=1 Tax=Neodiprion lecontei TaxID=441921 RepID=A0A6J0C4B7_NEOLC|nr:putative neutral sphingomyelinase [Neodiprion lecontei]XP_046486474.1 putative neutral sphingomyelinase [Neodiprion pinetum]XP_046486475.1 putative neutral sphingomyelinase [Neodiprion pinetum]XP_046598597.1 putative neutral sphingomyelinase [Neodiprion lecontei]XP_046625668.1 putative neutral sphingomyelinase [Neodiprion virginianus]